MFLVRKNIQETRSYERWEFKTSPERNRPSRSGSDVRKVENKVTNFPVELVVEDILRRWIIGLRGKRKSHDTNMNMMTRIKR